MKHDEEWLSRRRDELIGLSRHQRSELAARFAPHGRPSQDDHATYPRSKLMRSIRSHPKLWGAAAGLVLALGPGRFLGKNVSKVVGIVSAARGIQSLMRGFPRRSPY
jgi:hypothetical protein